MTENRYLDILSQFGITGASIEELGAYDDANFLVVSGEDKFILKEYRESQGLPGRLEAECRIMQILYEKFPGKIQDQCQTSEGEYVLRLEKGSEARLYRVLRYIEGSFLAEATPGIKLLESFGQFMARLDSTLMGIHDTAIMARQHPWDLQYFLSNEKLVPYISEASRRKLVEYFFIQYRDHVLPGMYNLRKSTLHNDANEWNVLARGNDISGIIDFGDLCYSPLVHEAVISITYLMLDKKDPLTAACQFLKAYHSFLPLLENEIRLIYYMVGARICTSLIHSSKGMSEQPGNTHITISARPMWVLIDQWIRLNPEYVTDQFLKCCGFTSPGTGKRTGRSETRDKFISKANSLSYNTPIRMTGAAFQYMFDSTGRTFLDMRNNIPHVGHCHPRVVEAGRRQMARLNTNTRYLYDALETYAEKLLSRFPDNFSRVFFVNSGSAATDLALRMAMNHTGLGKMAVLEQGYHGHTLSAISVSHYKYSGKGGKGKAENIVQLTLPDTYRGKYNDPATAGDLYADEANAVMNKEGNGIAALITEPVAGSGGHVCPPPAYLKRIYDYVRKQGGVCISDEVQTGFGRLGKFFWGFEMHEVEPDIVILGKPMGNGHPLAAVVTTIEISNSFENGMEFFSSFGGNPVSCSIGEAVLDVLDEEKLQENAGTIGNFLVTQLNAMRQKHPAIGDIRSRGLFLGIDLVRDPVLKEPDPDLANQLLEGFKEGGILTGTGGEHGNVLILKPPLCFNPENADQFLSVLESLLQSPS